MRHYKTVVLSEGLYKSETISLKVHTKVVDIEKQEWKILRKIHDRSCVNGVWSTRKTADFYTAIDKSTDAERKGRLKFYGHVYGIDNNRYTKKYLT